MMTSAAPWSTNLSQSTAAYLRQSTRKVTTLHSEDQQPNTNQYVLLNSSSHTSCRDEINLCPITNVSACETAARELALKSVSAHQLASNQVVEGCSVDFEGVGLLFNEVEYRLDPSLDTGPTFGGRKSICIVFDSRLYQSTSFCNVSPTFTTVDTVVASGAHSNSTNYPDHRSDSNITAEQSIPNFTSASALLTTNQLSARISDYVQDTTQRIITTQQSEKVLSTNGANITSENEAVSLSTKLASSSITSTIDFLNSSIITSVETSSTTEPTSWSNISSVFTNGHQSRDTTSHSPSPISSTQSASIPRLSPVRESSVNFCEIQFNVGEKLFTLRDFST